MSMTEPSRFEAIAQKECLMLLEIVRRAYKPSTAIESLIILAFSQGAAWALGVPSAFSKVDSDRMAEEAPSVRVGCGVVQ